jgi:hypothetical protein
MASIADDRSFDLLIETDGPLTAKSFGRFLQHLEPVVRKGAGASTRGFRLELADFQRGSVKIRFRALGAVASVATILTFVGVQMRPGGGQTTPLSRATANMILKDRAQAVIISGQDATVVFDRRDAEETDRNAHAPQEFEEPEEIVRQLIPPQTGLIRHIDGEVFVRLEEGAGPLLPVLDRRTNPESLRDRARYVVHGTIGRDRYGEIHDFELTEAFEL